MNVVSIMAHQDDEMRCLGTMLKCRARGDALHFISLTDGSTGVLPGEGGGEDAADIRHREMSALAAALGAGYLGLGRKDCFLYDTADLRIALVEAIRATGADLVFTHHHQDYSEDHTTTHRLVRHCCMAAALPFVTTSSPALATHPAVFCVEPHGPFPFEPSHFVDISGQEEEKVRVLKFHDSQESALQRLLHAGFDRICARPDAYWGEKAGCAYAEAFVPMAARGAIKPFAVLP